MMGKIESITPDLAEENAEKQVRPASSIRSSCVYQRDQTLVSGAAQVGHGLLLVFLKCLAHTIMFGKHAVKSQVVAFDR